MPWGFCLRSLICVALILPLRAIAADAVSPGDKPITPVVQLTVQPARFLLTRDNCVGNVLLRELQRQAVLIAARDELGLGTRDMVLREPFGVHNVAGATTVLIESRIWRGEQAQICLARFDGHQPVMPYALADLQVDQPQNKSPQWVSFKISNDQLVNYPEFVTKCEEASRTTYLAALKAENVLGDFQPRPIRWVEADQPGLVDKKNLEPLRHMDVFSQYLAIRGLHAQIEAEGASTERMSALVRAYANLGRLASGQWSQGSKVFLARSLLYAQRLVVHENASPMSLSVRAYSRAMAGLHAAALDDLNAAEKQNTPASQWAPPWAGMIRGLCEYDPTAIETSRAIGPWHLRPLATFLSAAVSSDDFTQPVEQFYIDRALEMYPGMFVLAPYSTDAAETNAPRPADQIVDQLPVVLVQSLKNANLPATVKSALNLVAPGDDSYLQIASVRDRLNAAAAAIPFETAEPSLGVLADLIEQQEMVAVIHKARTVHASGTDSPDMAALLTKVAPILKAHPWGPYVEAMGITSAESKRVLPKLEQIKDHDPGSWVTEAGSDVAWGDEDNPKLLESWRNSANLSADSVVGDYSPLVAEAKAVNHNTEHYLWLLRKTSPHSAALMEAWMTAMPLDRLQRQPKLYNQTLKQVEENFFDRPAVLHAACNWSESRADFERSLKLLQQINRLDPNGDEYDHIAKTEHHLGRETQAINDLLQGASLDDDTDSTGLYLRAACYLIEDHRCTDALTCIQLSAESPTPRSWQLMARCYETMGRLEDADECLRQQSQGDAQALVQYYLWARRLERKDAKAIHNQAALAFAPSDSYRPSFFLALADDQEQKAMDLLWRNFDKLEDPLDYAQALILGKKQGNSEIVTKSIQSLKAGDPLNQFFGGAFAALALSKDFPAGIAAFDSWVNCQLEDEDAMDWYSLAGRYLLAGGHPDAGKAYLIKSIHLSPHERCNYSLAWRELQKLGENPKQLLKPSATLP